MPALLVRWLFIATVSSGGYYLLKSSCIIRRMEFLSLLRGSGQSSAFQCQSSFYVNFGGLAELSAGRSVLNFLSAFFLLVSTKVLGFLIYVMGKNKLHDPAISDTCLHMLRCTEESKYIGDYMSRQSDLFVLLDKEYSIIA